MTKVFIHKRNLCRHATCDSCGTDYLYLDDIEIKAYDPDQLPKKLQEEIDKGIGIVPCPNCGKMSTAMLRQWIGGGVAGFAMIALFGGGLALVVTQIKEGSDLKWGLAFLCGAGLAFSAFSMLFWPFAPLMNKGNAIIPDQLERAKPAARVKYEVWLATQ